MDYDTRRLSPFIEITRCFGVVEKERNRQTDRETERQTDRQRQTETETDRQSETETEKQTDGQTDRHRLTQTQTNREFSSEMVTSGLGSRFKRIPKNYQTALLKHHSLDYRHRICDEVFKTCLITQFSYISTTFETMYVTVSVHTSRWIKWLSLEHKLA